MFPDSFELRDSKTTVRTEQHNEPQNEENHSLFFGTYKKLPLNLKRACIPSHFSDFSYAIDHNEISVGQKQSLHHVHVALLRKRPKKKRKATLVHEPAEAAGSISGSRRLRWGSEPMGKKAFNPLGPANVFVLYTMDNVGTLFSAVAIQPLLSSSYLVLVIWVFVTCGNERLVRPDLRDTSGFSEPGVPTKIESVVGNTVFFALVHRVGQKDGFEKTYDIVGRNRRRTLPENQRRDSRNLS